jgi:hypothetical protein
MGTIERLRALVSESSGDSVFSKTWLQKSVYLPFATMIAKLVRANLQDYLGNNTGLKVERAVGGDVYVHVEFFAESNHGSKAHPSLRGSSTYRAMLFFHGLDEDKAEVRAVGLSIAMPLVNEKGRVAAIEKLEVELKGQKLTSEWFNKAFKPLFQELRVKAADLSSDDTGWDYED